MGLRRQAVVTWDDGKRSLAKATAFVRRSLALALFFLTLTPPSALANRRSEDQQLIALLSEQSGEDHLYLRA
jgi:hypothetical protein